VKYFFLFGGNFCKFHSILPWNRPAVPGGEYFACCRSVNRVSPAPEWYVMASLAALGA